MPAKYSTYADRHKALIELQQKSVAEYTAFTDLLDDNSKKKGFRAYMNLGSMGPDYITTQRCLIIKDITIDGFVQAKGVSPRSYHLHSEPPNEFGIEADYKFWFSDVERKNGNYYYPMTTSENLAYVAAT